MAALGVQQNFMPFSSFHKGLTTFQKKLPTESVSGSWQLWWSVHGTQLSNYAVEIFQMTLESAWIYEIHHLQLTLSDPGYFRQLTIRGGGGL